MTGDADAGEFWAFAAAGEEPRYRLIDALDRDDLAEVRRLIGLHPELLDGFTYNVDAEVNPVEYAAYDGHVEVVRWLLKMGAKADTVMASGWSALSSAASHAWQSGELYESSRAGYFRVIRLLTDAGADPSAERNGSSPDEGFRMIHGVGLLDALAEFERRHGPG